MRVFRWEVLILLYTTYYFRHRIWLPIKDHFELEGTNLYLLVLGMEGIIYMMVPICIMQNNSIAIIACIVWL